MKTLFKYLLLVCVVLFSMEGLGQNNCQPEKFYFTDSVGNTNFKIPQRFVHRISEDRLLIFLSDTTTPPLIKFRIVKSGCDEDNPGSYTIQLDLINERVPVLLSLPSLFNN